ncbi:MAG: hypothetical protein ACI9XK_002897 [Granulosicoccus sp.]|jgi:hypothetical protein
MQLATLSVPSGLTTHIPDFTKLGYNFVRSQELGYDNKPLVQLAYKNPNSKPLALCFMPSIRPASESLLLARHDEFEALSADYLINVL